MQIDPLQRVLRCLAEPAAPPSSRRAPQHVAVRAQDSRVPHRPRELQRLSNVVGENRGIRFPRRPSASSRRKFEERRQAARPDGHPSRPAGLRRLPPDAQPLWPRVEVSRFQREHLTATQAGIKRENDQTAVNVTGQLAAKRPPPQTQCADVEGCPRVLV